MMTRFRDSAHVWAVILAGGDGMRLQELSCLVSGNRRPILRHGSSSGIHALGQRATEIIHIGQVVLAFGGTVQYFKAGIDIDVLASQAVTIPSFG
jgi:hypothetical protein